MPAIEREIRTGQTRQVGNYELTPLSQVLKIQLPWHHVGLIWNRPRAVIIRGSDGQENILPVRDVTRLVIWGMLAGGVLGAIMLGMKKRKE